MNALRSILAATDLSAPARHAAMRAARLAHEHQASLCLFHVIEGSTLDELRLWLGPHSDVVERLHLQASERLAHVAAEMRPLPPERVEAVLRSGRVLDEIAVEAEARAADLVVVGTRGEGFLRRLVVGTTAERLLRRATRPLLVVRQPPRGHYRRVLVAADFSPWSLQAVRLARRVAPHARLILFHAWEVPFQGKLRLAGVDADVVEHYRRATRVDAGRQMQALADAAALAGADWEPLVVEGEASIKLVEHEQECDADLVVIGKHGRSVAEDLLLGSVTRHVLAEGTVDVLVSPGHDA
jgi:nucleotide-binding universal stress UspA family protein